MVSNVDSCCSLICFKPFSIPDSFEDRGTDAPAKDDDAMVEEVLVESPFLEIKCRFDSR